MRYQAKLPKLVAIAASILSVAALPVVNVYAATSSNAYDTRNNIIFYDRNGGALNCSETGDLYTGGGTVEKGLFLGTDANVRQANLVRLLMGDFGLTPEQAAGPVGNFMHESAGTATEAIKLPPDVNEGDTTGAPPKFSGGYGWAQWTGSRQETFIQFAVSQGYMASEKVKATDAANYAYLKHELTKSMYKATIPELKKQSTPEDAAVAFEAVFERAGKPALEERKKHARTAYNAYKNSSTGGEVTSSMPAGCSGAGGAVAIIGNVAFPLSGSKKSVNNPEIFKNGDTSLGGHPYTAYDILADPGTEVVAFTSGVVKRVGEDKCPGRYIGIYNEESDLFISYMHLAFSNHLDEEDVVRAGDHVGVVGPAANGCGIPHLHIDAIKGSIRPACTRESCSSEAKGMFRSIGPQLYETFQKLPNN